MKYCAIALLLTGALALSACKEEGVTLSFVSSERVQAKDIFGFETREKRCKAIFEIKNEFSKPIDEITVRMDFFNAAGEAEVRSSVFTGKKTQYSLANPVFRRNWSWTLRNLEPGISQFETGEQFPSRACGDDIRIRLLEITCKQGEKDCSSGIVVAENPMIVP
ncbi:MULTISPECIES: hypothetical protein [Mameliella]|uniref:hypothetical protein n=1 Tax=Mameliella sp. LZ-28 TaxID=2484146 RepID=UPI00143F3007|nr:hypothetical protein [Mameliella sp. LZ-28]MCR9271800.1 hypothetical protein [Paracoccaceae bacterium]